jgi:hypothetical protein
MATDKKPLDKETAGQISQALQYYIEKMGSIPIPIPPAEPVTNSQSLLDELRRWLE